MTSAAVGAQLTVVRAHALRVIARRAWYDCVASWLDLAYIGGGPVALGPLLACWNAGKLRRACELCGGAVFVHALAGSPLSGSCWWAGWCEPCACGVGGRSPGDQSFSDLWLPLREHVLAWARDPHRSPITPPLAVLVSILEGGAGLEPISVRGEPLAFDWTCLALRRGERTLLRVDGAILRDPSGLERFTLADNDVLATDGALLLSVHYETASPSGRARRIEKMVRRSFGEPGERQTRLVTRGGVVLRRTGEGLFSEAGELVVRCSPHIPDAVVGITALGLHDLH